MAKGSGGVGKKSGSVSGAVAKAVAPAAKAASSLMTAPIGEFASAVYGALDKVQISNMAPISQVHEALPNKGNMTLDQFKKRLHEGYMEGKIDLARNDLGVLRYSSKLLNESLLNDRGREYVFVRKMY
jgi:hypothetical protein